MKLKLNREFLFRHLFAVAVFCVLCAWFGLDAFVKYPNTPAAELYAAIEKSPPPPDMETAKLESFKRQKTMTQVLLAAVTGVAAIASGFHLLAVAGMRFAFDENGFVLSGKRFAWSDVKSVDRSAWESKRILRISGDGWRATLDAWHHTGVKEAEAALSAALGGAS